MLIHKPGRPTQRWLFICLLRWPRQTGQLYSSKQFCFCCSRSDFKLSKSRSTTSLASFPRCSRAQANGTEFRESHPVWSDIFHLSTGIYTRRWSYQGPELFLFDFGILWENRQIHHRPFQYFETKTHNYRLLQIDCWCQPKQFCYSNEFWQLLWAHPSSSFYLACQTRLIHGRITEWAHFLTKLESWSCPLL